MDSTTTHPHPGRETGQEPHIQAADRDAGVSYAKGAST